MEDELKRFNSVHELHEEEYARMTNDLEGLSLSPGHQSEPATPPEYRETGFSNAQAYRNRLSSASMTSPISLGSRLIRSGSQIASPPSEAAQPSDYENEADKLPSKSVPTSRRGSSDRFSQYLPDSGIFGPRNNAKSVSLSYLITFCCTLTSLYLLMAPVLHHVGSLTLVDTYLNLAGPYLQSEGLQN